MLLACAAVLALFFAPALDAGVQFGHRDAGRLHHPEKRWIAAELARGHLPLWNPYAGLGTPVVSDAIDAPQHPFNALFLALPFEAAFKAWGLLSYLLAALGGFAWGWALGASAPAALCAGLGFALSGFLLSASDNFTFLTPLATAPWVLAAGARWIERGGSGWLAAVALSAAACAAGGDPMAWAVALGALPACGVVLGRERGRALPGFGRGLAALGTGALASAPFLLPVLAWVPASARAAAVGAGEAGRWNLHPLRLLELLVPHLMRPLSPGPSSEVYRVFAGDALSTSPWAASVYCGAALLALAALGAARSRTARALLAGAALLAWMALGPHAGWGEVAAHLPVVRALRYWEKLAGWPALLAAGAAGIGVDALAGGQAPRWFSRLLAGLGLAAAFGGAAAWWARPALAAALGSGAGTEIAAGTLALNLADGLLATGLALLALWAVVRASHRRLLSPAAAAWAAAAVAVLDLAVAGRGVPGLVQRDALTPPAPLAAQLAARPGLQRVVAPFEPTSARFPDRPAFESIWLWSARTLAAPWNVPWRIGNLEPYVAMPPGRLATILRTRRPSERPAIAGLWGVGGVVVPRAPELAREVGVAAPFTTIASDPELPAYVVELPHRPRAYVAARVEARDQAGALAFALDPSSGPSGTTVVEGPVPSERAEGEAQVELDEGERVEVRVEVRAGGPGLLVLNDQLAPGWSAEVDGASAPILPANYLARGVWVGPGSHRATFRYRTPLLREGWALFTLAGLAVTLHALRQRRRGGPPPAAEPSRAP